MLPCLRILLGLLLFLSLGHAWGSTVAPPMELEQFGDEGPAGLEDFAGKIVVLDFFAHWCAPCLPASRALEEGIQKHYQSQGGNPQGIAVEVVGVNIDQTLPARTRFYVKKAGLSHVLEDAGGTVHKALGGSGIPFIVVLDGRDVPTGGGNWQIVKKFTGFDGVSPIHEVIDTIGQEGQLATESEDNRPNWLTQLAAPVQAMLLEASVESLRSDAVDLLDTSFRYRHSVPGLDLDLALSFNEIGVGYQPPPDPHSFSSEVPVDRKERMKAYQASLRETSSGPLLFNVSAGIYDGYADYRSVWIAERYRQLNQYAPEYQEADPNGWNVGAGGRWEYLPASGFFQLDVAYQHDVVSPGYEWTILQGLVRGIEDLDTWSATAAFENVLTPRIRTLHQFAVAKTTAREARYSYLGSLNYAAGEDWVWRPTIGFVQESPTFDALSLGLSVEYALGDNWTAGINGRYYGDTGEIEDLAVISSAAPPMDAFQIGGSLRWAGEGKSFRLQAGHYETRYDEPGLGQVEYFHLYQGRDWVYIESAFSIGF